MELSIVILILLTLIALIFVSARAWKRGSDRAMCVLNQEQVQKGVRSVENLYGYQAGSQVTGLRDKIIGDGKFVQSMPVCPGGGNYDFSSGADVIPPAGMLYMSCSLAGTQDHTPVDVSEW